MPNAVLPLDVELVKALASEKRLLILEWLRTSGRRADRRPERLDPGSL